MWAAEDQGPQVPRAEEDRPVVEDHLVEDYLVEAEFPHHRLLRINHHRLRINRHLQFLTHLSHLFLSMYLSPDLQDHLVHQVPQEEEEEEEDFLPLLMAPPAPTQAST